MAISQADQLKKLQSQQEELQKKIDQLKEQRLIKVGKLADKHGLTMWDDKKLEEAFKLIKETYNKQKTSS